MRLPRPARGRALPPRDRRRRARAGPRQDRGAVGHRRAAAARGCPRCAPGGGPRPRRVRGHLPCAPARRRARHALQPGSRRRLRGGAARCGPRGCGRAAASGRAARTCRCARGSCARTCCGCARRPRGPAAAAGPTGRVIDYGSDGARPPRRHPRGGHGPVVAGAGRELQPRLARVLRRPLAGRARAWSTASPTAGAWAADCRDVRFAFAPNRRGRWSYLLSLPVVAVLLVLVAVGVPPAASGLAGAAAAGRPAASRAGRCAAHWWPRGAAPVAAFLFAIRAGVLIGPAVALVLWRGLGARALARGRGAAGRRGVPAVALRRRRWTSAASTASTPPTCWARTGWRWRRSCALAVALWRGLSTASGANRAPAAEPPRAP